QAKEKIDVVGFAPTHQIFAAKAAVAAQQDRHAGPLLPKLSHDPLDVRQAAGRGVDVAGPQERGQRVIAAENVQRQITIIAIVAVKKPPQLLAVNGGVGSIEIEDDAVWTRGTLAEKRIDKEVLHLGQIADDFLVAAVLIGADGCEFESIE